MVNHTILLLIICRVEYNLSFSNNESYLMILLIYIYHYYLKVTEASIEFDIIPKLKAVQQ
jgi:hypothetical protein